MNAIVLCGGHGSRLDGDREKPLRRVGGVPMVERVSEGLRAADAVETVHAAVSPNAPETVEWARSVEGVHVIETPGEGYVADLGVALETAGTPAVTVAADLPLLAGEHVDRAVEGSRQTDTAGDGTASVSVLTPARLKRRLGVSTDESADDGWLPTGLNVVGDGERSTERRSWDARLAVNVNYERDLDAAEALLDGGER